MVALLSWFGLAPVEQPFRDRAVALGSQPSAVLVLDALRLEYGGNGPVEDWQADLLHEMHFTGFTNVVRLGLCRSDDAGFVDSCPADRLTVDAAVVDVGQRSATVRVQMTKPSGRKQLDTTATVRRDHRFLIAGDRGVVVSVGVR